jgi:O-antigen ligase
VLLGSLALCAEWTAPTIFCCGVLAWTALVDLPGKVSVGSFSLNAFATLALCVASVTILVVGGRIHGPPGIATVTLGLLFVQGVVSLLSQRPTIASLQNLAILLLFIVSILLGSALANRNALARVTMAFTAATAVTLLLYGVGLVAGGFGSGTIIGSRSYALAAVIGVAWNAPRWRYGLRYGRVLTLLSVIFVTLSLSRLALAVCGIVFALAWFEFRYVRGWLRSIGIALCGVIAGFLLVSHFSMLHDRVYEGDIRTVGPINLNVSGRGELWGTTWASFTESPVVGHGVGFSTELIRQQFGNTISHPHNDYLRLLNDYGVVGLSLWIIAYVALLVGIWHRSNGDDPPEIRAISRSASLGLIGLGLSMITDNPIDYLFVLAPIGVLVGMSYAGHAITRASAPTSYGYRQRTQLDR